MTPKPKWLIETNVFEDNEEQLVKEIKKQGMKVNLIDDSRTEDIVKYCINFLYEPQDCVIFYGSLGLGRKLKKTPWVPGVYLNEKAFECTSYYPVLGNTLVHSNYLMMPYGDVKRRKNDLYRYFNDDKIFIRPNSGNKQFTGMVVKKHDFEDCIKLAGFYDVEPDLLVVVSDVYNIEKEWRFVVVNGEVICGSLYRDWSAPEKIYPGTITRDYVLLNSHSVYEECNDKNALSAAEICANMYNPDNCYTIDVAKINSNAYGILEVGCFSCAGMYGNDLEIIVDKVSEAALNEWKEYNE